MSSSTKKADDRQIGGNHYKTGGEEHWTRMFRLFGPGYFIGCITKYVERYRSKNGVEDLLKAQHFIEKLIELESPPAAPAPAPVPDGFKLQPYAPARDRPDPTEPGRSYVDPDFSPSKPGRLP
jgi:hypothetical protein